MDVSSLLVRCLGGSDFRLLLGKTLGEDSVVLGLLLLLGLESSALEGSEVSAALETEGGDKTLDLGTNQQQIGQVRPKSQIGPIATD